MVPISANDLVELEDVARELDLRPGKLAALMLLRALSRRAIERIRPTDGIHSNEKVVVSLPKKEDHDFIIARAESLTRALQNRVSARQLVGHLLKDEIRRKWFKNNLLKR